MALQKQREKILRKEDKGKSKHKKKKKEVCMYLINIIQFP